ncbi:MAG: hypothetical protein KF721_00255 [Ignavibacteriaceae bacterium]|nr:hypothetical protein [Ignavibacteriaceae bacterium]
MDEITENTTGLEPKSKGSRGNIPASDIDLLTTAKSVVEKWRHTPEITLIWTNANNLVSKTTDYEQILTARISEGSFRPAISNQLKNLDKQIDIGIGFIKDYLKELYGNDDKAHYPQYGIIKAGTTYKLQADRDNRIASLNLILEALNRDGLSGRTYGTAYWENIRNQYLPLKQEAASMDESVAGKVSGKNQLKDELKKHLVALINVLKANYPDTYKSEMRAWGFQKEKY